MIGQGTALRDVGLQALENKVLSRGTIGKSAPILAEITVRKSQVDLIKYHPEERKHAIMELQHEVDQFGPDLVSDAVSALVEALTDENTFVARDAARVLGKMGSTARGAVSALMNAVGGADYFLGQVSARALGDIGPAASAAVPTLIKALRGKYPYTQVDAAYALCRIDPKFTVEAVATLMKVLQQDPDIEWRCSAAETLGDIGPDASAAVPALIDALRVWNATPHCDVRSSAKQALIEIGSTAIPALVEYLRGPDTVAKSYVEDILRTVGLTSGSSRPPAAEA